MYTNVPNTARRQVNEGYIILRKCLDVFIFQKNQLLEDCRILSSLCYLNGLLSVKVYYHNLQIIYKRETISLQLNRELNSATASLLSVLVVFVRGQMLRCKSIF